MTRTMLGPEKAVLETTRVHMIGASQGYSSPMPFRRVADYFCDESSNLPFTATPRGSR